MSTRMKTADAESSSRGNRFKQNRSQMFDGHMSNAPTAATASERQFRAQSQTNCKDNNMLTPKQMI